MLTSNGEIHVTHKTAYPFSLWRLEDLAGEVGLSLLEKANFRRWDYPYYQNKRGYASRGKTWNSTFPVGECCTFKFVLLKMDCIMLQEYCVIILLSLWEWHGYVVWSSLILKLFDNLNSPSNENISYC